MNTFAAGTDPPAGTFRTPAIGDATPGTFGTTTRITSASRRDDATVVVVTDRGDTVVVVAVERGVTVVGVGPGAAVVGVVENEAGTTVVVVVV
ncbi:MAG: hypothetical protein ACO3ON_07815, partial [Ilumatobacteraceae bacterium]